MSSRRASSGKHPKMEDGDSVFILHFWKVLRLALAGVMSLLPVRPALAHAELVSADPAPGARLESPPAEIRLTFDEALHNGSTFTVFDRDFQPAGGVSPVIDSALPEQMASRLAPLALGEYTVQWKAITEDGGEVTGSYSFSVVNPESRADLARAALTGGLVLALTTGVLFYRRIRRAR